MVNSKLTWMKSPWIRFLGFFTLSYFAFVIMFNVPAFESIVNIFFRNTSELFLDTMLPDAKITATIGHENDKRDVNVMAINFTWTPEMIERIVEEAKAHRIENISVPHRFVNYYLYQFFSVPLMFLLSLIFATPLPIKDKIIALFIGFSSLWIFILVKLFLFVLFTISNAKIGIYELGESNMLALQKMANVLTLGVSILLAVVIWGLTSFRKSILFENIRSIFDSLQKIDNSQ